MSICLESVVKQFEAQRALILYFFDNFQHKDAKNFVELVLGCKGTVVLSGVGKSGFICSKIAASLASIGVKSTFLNPLDALHGDIGNLSSDDVLVLFSKSGTTEELIRLVPSARRRSVQLVSVTCTAANTLAGLCDMRIHLPLQRELCSFNLAPVTSTVVQLIFGDTITAILMQENGISLESYALNHPAGAIGRRLVLCACDIMLSGDDVPCVEENSSLAETVLEMSRCGVGCAVVRSNSIVVGIFTDGDLRRLVGSQEFNLETSISMYFNRHIRTVSPQTKLADAQHVFSTPTLVSCLPVVDLNTGGLMELCGLITLSQTMKSLE